MSDHAEIMLNALGRIAEQRHDGCYGGECFCEETMRDIATGALAEAAALTPPLTADTRAARSTGRGEPQPDLHLTVTQAQVDARRESAESRTLDRSVKTWRGWSDVRTRCERNPGKAAVMLTPHGSFTVTYGQHRHLRGDGLSDVRPASTSAQRE